MAIIIFILLLKYSRINGYASLFAAGIIFHCISCSWVFWTLRDISQQSLLFVTGLFILFISFYSLQFPVVLFLWKHLPKVCDRFALRGAVAWVAIECIPGKLFPWHIGHTQLMFPNFVQIADIGGAPLVSFFIFWICEALIRESTCGKRTLYHYAFPLILICIINFYGWIKLAEFSKASAKNLDVALIQTKESTSESLAAGAKDRIQRMAELTETSQETFTLAIWPESALPQRINESIFEKSRDSLLPNFQKPIYLLSGGETFRLPKKLFNSAILIHPDGTIPLPYHKRTLIPFGEFIPFRQYAPFLSIINPLSQTLSTGDKAVLFSIPTEKPNTFVQIAPMICYEEMLPWISAEAVRAGAEVLVSLSNTVFLKSWGTFAISQQQMVSAFRSIENRRTLLRVGNIGGTSVISPTGEVLKTLSNREEGAIVTSVPAISTKTIFTEFYVDLVTKLIAGLIILSCIVTKMYRVN